MDLEARHLNRLLEGKTIGKRIYVLGEVDSTNRYAAELAREGAEEGEVVIADSQSRGRGRLGRTWQSPPGRNIYVSVILRPSIRPADSPLITLTAGVAVAEALSAYCADAVTLKWPNDVMIRGKKICGMLAEMKLRGAEIDFIVVGIGININMKKADFDEPFKTATSLRIELDRDVSRADVTVKLLGSFEKWYGVLMKEGFAPVREKWISLSGILGREIHVHSGDKIEKGRAAGFDEDGALLLLDEAGRTRRIISGDVVLAEG